MAINPVEVDYIDPIEGIEMAFNSILSMQDCDLVEVQGLIRMCQEEALRLAKLGAAVEAMPRGYILTRLKDAHEFGVPEWTCGSEYDARGKGMVCYRTPIEALNEK